MDKLIHTLQHVFLHLLENLASIKFLAAALSRKQDSEKETRYSDTAQITHCVPTSRVTFHTGKEREGGREREGIAPRNSWPQEYTALYRVSVLW